MYTILMQLASDSSCFLQVGKLETSATDVLCSAFYMLHLGLVHTLQPTLLGLLANGDGLLIFGSRWKKPGISRGPVPFWEAEALSACKRSVPDAGPFSPPVDMDTLST